MIAMSGGVDSAVAALRTVEDGFDAVGVTMSLQAFPGAAPGCGQAEISDARDICGQLRIPHRVVELSSAFQREVVDRFVSGYEAGLTPNPCIDCNRHIKFGALYDQMEQAGFDALVTGHYARIETESGAPLLKRAADRSKDQSYVLYNLRPEQLSKIRFPLGCMTKAEARALAESRGLVSAHKKDSQDICFVPDGDYASFLTRYTGRTYPAGRFVDLDGNPLGQHSGFFRYTVGQRKGLGLAMGAPMYVVSKDPKTGDVVLGKNSDLFATTLEAEQVNLLCPERLDRILTAKTRYYGAEAPATVTRTSDTTVRVVFVSPQRAITPGQSVVFYDGDVVVGGGVIAASGRPA